MLHFCCTSAARTFTASTRRVDGAVKLTIKVIPAPVLTDETAGLVQPMAAPFVLPSVQHYIDFVRSSASPVMQMLKALPAAAQAAAWDEMRAQLQVFSTPQGWAGPNELLICSATAGINEPPSPT